MHLFEEYFIRNNIKTPIVKHCVYSCCFIKEKFWELLLIQWQQEPNKVGNYRIQRAEPSINGFKISNHSSDFVAYDKTLSFHRDISRPIFVFYEDYEDLILSLSFETAQDEKESVIVLWEMFLRSLDENIVHYNLFDKLSHSFFSNNKSDRFEIILENIEYLHSNNLEIYSKWKNNFLPFLGNYSFWLANTIRKN